MAGSVVEEGLTEPPGPLIAALLAGRPPAFILDVRAEEAFAAGHLPGAYNVPWGEITARGYELPPRSEPLLVCCAGEDFPSTVQWFDTRHEKCRWQVEVLPMSIEILAIVPPEYGATPPGRFLFSPSPLLTQSAALLEGLLGQAASAGVRPRALDVGAGSGRDAVILAVAGWHVTCLDRDARALRRCSAVAERHGCGERCSTVQATLKKAGDLVAALSRDPAEPPGDGEPSGWHVITVNRHLHRPTLRELGELLEPGGLLLFHSFLLGNSHPSDEQSVLKPGELWDLFSSTLVIERDEELRIEDGRLLTFFVARRPVETPPGVDRH